MREPNRLYLIDAYNLLYRFFHGSATTLGVFYPTHYIFASFPSFENAKKAGMALQAAGYRELVAASAAETFRFMNEIRADVGLARNQTAFEDDLCWRR